METHIVNHNAAAEESDRDEMAVDGDSSAPHRFPWIVEVHVLAVVLSVLPVELSVSMMVAPATRAPEGSLITPRSEVVAFWARVRVAVERVQSNTQPQRDRFTAVPPKGLALMCVLQIKYVYASPKTSWLRCGSGLGVRSSSCGLGGRARSNGNVLFRMTCREDSCRGDCDSVGMNSYCGIFTKDSIEN